MAEPKKAIKGAVFNMNDGSCLEVLEYISAIKIIVQFTDRKTEPFFAHIGNLRKGKYKNPYCPSVCGVGFEGSGNFSLDTHRIIANKWREMLRRAYSSKELLRRPNTGDVEVCEEWHNFQNFAEWCSEHYKEGYELDKDILSPGNSKYCPRNCCFVPREINTKFPKRYTKSNRVYKDSGKNNFQVNYFDENKNKRMTKRFKDKESAVRFKLIKTKERLKYLADKYKYDLSAEVYNALICWEGY